MLLLGSAILTGLRLPARGDRTLAFEGFGFVEGVLALLVLFLFLQQGVLASPRHLLERALLAYWLGSTAVLLKLALPPPGLGYWIGTVLIAAALLGASGGEDRRRTLLTLGLAIALCGTLRFAIIPFVWRHASLPDLGPLELGGISDWAKGLVTEHEPVRAGNQVLNVMGVALYAVALRRSWPDELHDPLSGLGPEERDRLLRALLSTGGEAARARLPAPAILIGRAGSVPEPPAREPPAPGPDERPPRGRDEPPGPDERPPRGPDEPPGPGRPAAPVGEPGPDPDHPQSAPLTPGREPGRS